MCKFITIAWRAKAEKEKNKNNTAMLHENGLPTPLGVTGLYRTLVDTDNKTPPLPYVPEFLNNNPFRPATQTILQAPTLTINGGILEIEEPIGDTIQTHGSPSTIMADIADMIGSKMMQMPDTPQPVMIHSPRPSETQSHRPRDNPTTGLGTTG